MPCIIIEIDCILGMMRETLFQVLTTLPIVWDPHCAILGLIAVTCGGYLGLPNCGHPKHSLVAFWLSFQRLRGQLHDYLFFPLTVSPHLLMIPFSTLVNRLTQDAQLYQQLHFQTLCRFFDVLKRFVPRILTSAPRCREGLPPLPANIRDVLAVSLELSYELVDKLWTQTGDMVVHQYQCSKVASKPWRVDDVLSQKTPQFGLGMSGLCLS